MPRRSLKVIWMPDALDDLHEIYTCIRMESPRTALKMVKIIRNSTRHLNRFPLLGRMVPEFEDPALRE